MNTWKSAARSLSTFIALALFATLSLAGVNLTLVWPDGTTLSQAIEPGWNKLGDTGPMGATLFETRSRLGVPAHCLRIENSVGDNGPGGTVFFRRIEVACPGAVAITPRAGWRVTGSTIVVGAEAQECFPPRSSLRIRWADGADWHAIFDLPPPQAFAVPFGRKSIAMPNEPRWIADGIRVRDAFLVALASGAKQSYTSGLIPSLRELGLGVWRPHLLALADQVNGGGMGIEPVPWERYPEIVLAHDAAMERHAVGWRSKATGEPLPTLQTDSGNYSLARGWTRTSVPTSVSRPVDPTNVWDNRRLPLAWNTGSCPYELQLAGAAQYWYAGGFPPHDGEHIIRATYRSKVAGLVWGDPCATDDLQMIAADCRYAWKAAPAVIEGAGSGAIGREFCWVVDALVAGGMERHASKLIAAAAKAQMPNGFVQRQGIGWPAIPNPYTISPDIPDPILATRDCAASMEAMFMAHAFARAGRLDNASRTLRGLFDLAGEIGGVPKFVAVADHGGAAHRMFIEWAGGSGYFNSTGAGLMACLEPEGEWLGYALDFATPTQGLATSIADLKARTIREETGRSQVVALMSALEQAGL